MEREREPVRAAAATGMWPAVEGGVQEAAGVPVLEPVPPEAGER